MKAIWCAGLLLLAALLLAPPASASVSVDDIVVPERTAAAKPFPVSLTLRNEGGPRSVYLFGALYDPEEGKTCGPATDPRFRTFTHVVQEVVQLPADSTTAFPPEGERWLHRYDPAEGEGPTAEFCVFVANATSGPVISYESFATTTLSVRPRNAPPAPSFAFEPEAPRVGESVAFRAQGSDADGDPIVWSWDFGRDDASGRAVGSGERASHAFYPEGEYAVTLTASDGIDNASTTRTLAVGAAHVVTEDHGLPVPAWITAAALACAALRRAPPRRSR